MKKKIFWGLVSFFLCACGSDSGSNANSPETELLVSEISSSEISYSSESNATPDKESPSSGKSALSSSSAAETQSSDTASDAPLSSGTVTGTQYSSSATASTTSSSSAAQSGSGPAGGISFPQERGCRPTAPVESETFGVVDAFIQKRVETLVQQGLSNDSARDIAIEELQRESLWSIARETDIGPGRVPIKIGAANIEKRDLDVNPRRQVYPTPRTGFPGKRRSTSRQCRY